ncbi:MAG: hypothetical protein LBT20_05460 [Clostridiales bacterium]|nr:hypothetical protein [Clostridiales bacterium]
MEKKTMTKVGGIISLIIYIIATLLVALATFVVIIFLAAATTIGESAPGGIPTELWAVLGPLGGVIIIIFLIALAVTILGIVFSAKTLKYAKMDPKAYAEKKGGVLGLGITLLIFAAIAFAGNGFNNVGTVLLTLVLLASAVLIIVDYALNPKALAVVLEREAKAKEAKDAEDAAKAEAERLHKDEEARALGSRFYAQQDLSAEKEQLIKEQEALEREKFLIKQRELQFREQELKAKEAALKAKENEIK